MKAKRIIQSIAFLVMTMCATQASGCAHNDNIISVSAPEFEKEIKTDSVQLLDVRTPQELSLIHI